MLGLEKWHIYINFINISALLDIQGKTIYFEIIWWFEK